MKCHRRFVVASVLLAVAMIIAPIEQAFATTLNQKELLDAGILYYNVSSGDCSTAQYIGAGTASAKSVESYTAAYGEAAFNIGKQYGIPYEVILGQSALESGWGASALSAQYNNFFGIKVSAGWTGATVTFQTAEDYAGDGNMTTIEAVFRAYDTPQAGFEGYAQFIHDNSRYATALQYPQDAHQYIVEIKNAGYATDSSYVDKVWGITQSFITYIQENDLFPPSTDVTPDAAPPATTTSSSGDSSCSGSSADLSSITSAAISMSWPPGDSHVGTMTPNDAYIQGMIKANLNGAYADGSGGMCTTINPDNNSTGSSCDVFVSTVYRNTVDPDFPAKGSSGLGAGRIRDALGVNPNYEEISNLGNTSNMKTGDILVHGGHIMMYIVLPDGSETIASASCGQRTSDHAGPVNQAFTDSRGPYSIFRWKGGS